MACHKKIYDCYTGSLLTKAKIPKPATSPGPIVLQGHHPYQLISFNGLADSSWYVHTGVTSTQQTQEKATLPGHHRIAQGRLTAVNCTVVDLDKLFDLKVRINSFFASIPEQCCKVCYILGERTTSACGAVCKKFSGVFLCPQ